MATPDQIRDLAERGDLPAEALPTLIALWPGNGRTGRDDGSRLAEATGRVLPAIWRHAFAEGVAIRFGLTS